MNDAGTPSEQPQAEPSDEGPQGFNVGRSTRRGVRSSLIAQMTTQLGSVVATVILARLLDPASFGILALAQSLLGAAALVSLTGVSAALITRKGDVLSAASTYFWLALIVGVMVVGFFALLAGPLTARLGQPAAAPYVTVLSVSFALEMLALVPNAILQRRFRFGWLNGSVVVSCWAVLHSRDRAGCSRLGRLGRRDRPGRKLRFGAGCLVHWCGMVAASALLEADRARRPQGDRCHEPRTAPGICAEERRLLGGEHLSWWPCTGYLLRRVRPPEHRSASDLDGSSPGHASGLRHLGIDRRDGSSVATNLPRAGRHRLAGVDRMRGRGRPVGPGVLR